MIITDLSNDSDSEVIITYLSNDVGSRTNVWGIGNTGSDLGSDISDVDFDHFPMYYDDVTCKGRGPKGLYGSL